MQTFASVETGSTVSAPFRATNQTWGTTMTNLMSRVAILIASFLLLTAAGCAGDARHSSTGEAIDDTVITTKVKAAILNDPALKVLQINVETFRGTVQLSGFVESRDMAQHAIKVVRDVAGVKDVRNDMRMR